jgi:hypothetical protein
MKAVRIGLKGKRDPDLPPLVNGIVAGATGKVELEESPVTLASLTTLVTEGTTLLDEETQARDTWLAKRTARKQKFKKLRNETRRFAVHANSVYDGDKLKLQAIGLDVVELGPVLGVLPAPLHLRSRSGKLDGSIELKWNFTIGRDFYEVECAESSDGPWKQIYQGKFGRTTCGGLISGKEYFFRVRAHNGSGPGAWSDITKKRAS